MTIRAYNVTHSFVYCVKKLQYYFMVKIIKIIILVLHLHLYIIIDILLLQPCEAKMWYRAHIETVYTGSYINTFQIDLILWHFARC